jgi:hypothetical protein
MRIGRPFGVVAMVLALLCGARPAAAYRPFDGTDAAVADLRQIEIGLGPVEYLRDGTQRSLFVPSIVINYGFAPDWEGTVQVRIAPRCVEAGLKRCRARAAGSRAAPATLDRWTKARRQQHRRRRDRQQYARWCIAATAARHR